MVGPTSAAGPWSLGGTSLESVGMKPARTKTKATTKTKTARKRATASKKSTTTPKKDAASWKAAGPPRDVDDYLSRLPNDVKKALEGLRKTIRQAAPKAVELISYQVPTFRANRMLVSFAAAKTHCSFFVMSPKVMEAHADDLEGYDTSKGTIRFQPDEPLPATLVKKLVKARLVEDAAHAK
jgi:uncharacterized protein YdhG (YjbR/CyaY superfamily)